MSLRDTTQAIAKKLKVSFDAIDSWRRGMRCIPESQIVPLVLHLENRAAEEELTPQGRNLIRQLRAARKEGQPVRSWKEYVGAGQELRVEQARYIGAGKVWGRIFYPFLDSACIEHKTDRPLLNFQQLQHAVWTGQLDIALGLLATPRLSLKLWFFNSPIRYRLNCIVPSDFVATYNMSQIRKLLACRRESREVFVPIIMQGEVGESYATILKLDELTTPVLVPSLDADAFYEEFLRKRTNRRVPLIIVDEITCLAILRRLEHQGELVFPLVPNLKDRKTLIPPSFPLGICVSRNEHVGHAKKNELMAFIQDALPSYIEGNAESIAFSYVALHNRIGELVKQALPKHPEHEQEEWLCRTFSLPHEMLALQPAHWRVVLQRSVDMLRRKASKTRVGNQSP